MQVVTGRETITVCCVETIGLLISIPAKVTGERCASRSLLCDLCAIDEPALARLVARRRQFKPSFDDGDASNKANKENRKRERLCAFEQGGT